MRTSVLCLILALGASACATGPSELSYGRADRMRATFGDPMVRTGFEKVCLAEPMTPELREELVTMFGEQPDPQAEYCRRLAIVFAGNKLTRDQLAEVLDGRTSPATTVVFIKALREVPPAPPGSPQDTRAASGVPR
jgi:hypothetical protein